MNKMLRARIVCAALLSFLVYAGAASQEVTPLDGKATLARIDAYREFAKAGFSFDFSLEDGKAVSSVMRVYLDGDNRETSIAKYALPKKYASRVVLTVKNAFFIFDRGMPAPVRITPREMLFGQASAGDITRISFSGMYSVESQTQKGSELVISLKAIPDKGATYDMIDLRVDGVTFKPIAATCKGASGTAIKTIAYESFTVFSGKELLSAFSITDCANGETSKVRLDNFRGETLPPSSFTLEAIKYVR